MFKKLSKYLLVSLFGLFALTGTAFADNGDDCANDPQACFEFKEDGEVVPKSGKPKRTFSVPPIKAGFVVDFHNFDLLPSLGIQLFDFEVPSFNVFDHKFFSLGEDFSVNLGIATSRIFLSFDWEAIPIVKLGPSIWVGYNVRNKDPAYGVGLSILDF